MRNGLGAASLHLRRGVEAVHSFVQRRGFNCEYSKEAKTSARADNVGFDQNEIIFGQLYGGPFVYLQRWCSGEGVVRRELKGTSAAQPSSRKQPIKPTKTLIMEIFLRREPRP
jgi:hypothetical protein